MATETELKNACEVAAQQAQAIQELHAINAKLVEAAGELLRELRVCRIQCKSAPALIAALKLAKGEA